MILLIIYINLGKLPKAPPEQDSLQARITLRSEYLSTAKTEFVLWAL